MADRTPVVLPISRDAIYTLHAFRRISGLGAAALRQYRRDGLKLRYLGKRCYVAGEDFIAFLAEHGQDHHPSVRGGNGSPDEGGRQ